MVFFEKARVIEAIPAPNRIRERLGDALREVELLRRLLKVSERAEVFREADRMNPVRCIQESLE